MKTSFLVIVIVLVFSACRKNELDKIEGPSLKDQYGKFQVINEFKASNDSVDFYNGQSVYFEAEFSKTVNWTLSITGMTSGAKKVFQGTGKIVDNSSTTWNGSTTQFPVFKTENCKAVLKFDSEPDTFVVYVKALSKKNNTGFLIADFETPFKSGWSSFIQSGANMDFQIKSDNTAAEGNAHYNMAGTVNWDWLIGLVNFKASAYGAPVFPLNANPGSNYFNVLIWGEPGLTNSLVLFQFQEDDNLNGSFSSQTEDMYSLQVNVNWEGWKLITVRYSDLTCLVNGAPATPSGNRQLEPNKLMQINMLHLANPSSGYAKTKLDYMIITQNAPLEP
jgi:hypothetical protein